MTVIGSLEDLSFPDILQVVHVSRQSGTLVLSVPSGERRVRFRNGLVCGATLGAPGRELEEVLLQRGLVDSRALQNARARNAASGVPLSSALVAAGAITQESIEQVVRQELRTILRSLVLLQEGEFRFEAEETPAPSGDGLGLSEGLDPGAILEGLPPRPGRPARARALAEPAIAPPPATILVAIERSLLRRLVQEELGRSGAQVEVCGSPAEAVGLARSLAAETGVGLVCDLLLPEESGGGWRGGLQLARRVREAAPAATVVVVGEPGGAETAAAARAAGAAAYVPVPDLAACAGAEVGTRLRAFAQSVARAVRREGTHPEPAAGGGPAVRAVDALSLLRGLIGEMRAESQTEIPLLVLRLAAEYFERGVLFAVRDGQACGSGAFETTPERAALSLDQRLRGVNLPLQRGSILQRAVQERETYVGPIAPTRPNAGLLRSLGEPAPGEAALLPLSSGRHVYGILYGDNARSGRPVGDLKALEIFLSQAGMALENAFLQRRLASLAGPGAGGAGGVAGVPTHA